MVAYRDKEMVSLCVFVRHFSFVRDIERIIKLVPAKTKFNVLSNILQRYQKLATGIFK
jgi:hypothetical protein